MVRGCCAGLRALKQPPMQGMGPESILKRHVEQRVRVPTVDQDSNRFWFCATWRLKTDVPCQTWPPSRNVDFEAPVFVVAPSHFKPAEPVPADAEGEALDASDFFFVFNI